MNYIKQQELSVPPANSFKLFLVDLSTFQSALDMFTAVVLCSMKIGSSQLRPVTKAEF